MFYVGCHISFKDGYEGVGKQAKKINASTFQFFTRSPRGGKAKPFDIEDVNKLSEIIENEGMNYILAHAPYTLNPASDKEYVREYALEVMQDDLMRMNTLKNSMYNFHPGSHVGQGVDTGIDYIVEMLNEALSPDQNTIVLLETMAGKGSEIGSRFEELGTIIKQVDVKEKIGVCWDTCHLYDGGYDLVNNLDDIIEEFDSLVGLEYLKAIHINDSIHGLASHKDRHAPLGEGTMGFEFFEILINHPKLAHLPFYLETPQTLEGYAKEIESLRKVRKSTT